MAQCNSAAEEFISCLDNLTVTPGSHWSSFQAAIRSIWSAKKVREMSERLDSFRSEVALRILVLLNAKHDLQMTHQDGRFDHLDKKAHEIVEVMSINQQSIRSVLTDHANGVKRLQHENDATARRRHEETIAAILTLRDGNTKILTRKPAAFNHHNGFDVEDLGEMRKNVMTLKGESILGGRAEAQMGDFELIERKILDCLHFRQIYDRFETVAQAHRNTFQWIYSGPLENDAPWSDFVEWLEKGQGCYWVNGKAGSGKSTLMKYIHGEERTRQALLHWAGNDILVFASFFFWNLGSTMQKSQIGLLRSLLHDVLEQHPELIPTVFPELCRTATKLKTKESLSEPTLPELIKGMRNLIHQKAAPLRICFLVDGLDEYDGDCSEISELFASVSSSPGAKMILSSRPIPACVDAFSSCPHLRLQDLTYGDIQQYVEDKLNGHPNMKKLEAREGAHAVRLVSELVEKASGVFLWVILAVRSLLNGLQNYDRVADLEKRLDELPADLAQLYAHMIKRMERMYRQQASELFQLILLSSDIQTDEPLTALQLSFTEKDDMQATLRAEQKEITSAAEAARAEEMEGRIRSRCCGLVEIQDRKFHWKLLPSITRPSVEFLHKTVVEFLRDASVWDDICGETAGTDFNPIISLAGSCVCLTKVLPTSKNVNVDESFAWQSAHYCLAYCSIAETDGSGSTVEFLDELDASMSHHWKAAWRYSSSFAGSGKTEGHWSKTCAVTRWKGVDILMSLARYDCFMSLAIQHCLVSYLYETFGNHDAGAVRRDRNKVLIREKGAQLLAQCVRILDVPSHLTVSDGRSYEQIIRADGTAERSGTDGARIAVLLLEAGVNPNTQVADETTPWKLVLDRAIEYISHHEDFLHSFDKHGYTESYSKMVVIFVLSGADMNAVRIYRQKRFRDTTDPQLYRRSALHILNTLFQQTAWEQKGRSTEEVAAVDLFRKRLTGLMIERGAKSREWLDSKLIAGPPEDDAKTLAPGQLDVHRSLNNTSPLSLDGKSRGRDKLRRFFGSKSSSNISEVPCQPAHTTRDDITLKVNNMTV